jgi:hypothetical protein
LARIEPVLNGLPVGKIDMLKVDRIPRSANGKIQRNSLKSIARANRETKSNLMVANEPRVALLPISTDSSAAPLATPRQIRCVGIAEMQSAQSALSAPLRQP